jgi:uncharacterized membrane protein YcaP (DUF421 family)
VDLFHTAIPPWEFIVRCALIDTVLLAALRIFGKREIGQFTLYDLVLILLVANAVQPAMTGPDNSVTGGLIIIGVLVLINSGISQLDRIDFFHRILAPRPRIIIRDGKFVDAALGREGIDKEECDMAIREHGVGDVKDVRLGMLEPDGTISIVPMDDQAQRSRRRVRYLRHG